MDEVNILLKKGFKINKEEEKSRAHYDYLGDPEGVSTYTLFTLVRD